MIIKLDHITYVTERVKVQTVIKEFETRGYTLKFKELNLPNLSIKKALMKTVQETHDIYFLDKDDSFAIEVIAYDQVCSTSQNKYEDGVFSIEVKSRTKLYDTVSVFGIDPKENDDRYRIKGLFDKKNLEIKVIEKPDIENTYLDMEGYGCLTFLVDSVERTKENIKALDCSDISMLTVNGRELKIFFATSKEARDIIIEFISLGAER